MLGGGDPAQPWVYVGLGANLGDAVNTLRQAARQLLALEGTTALRCSSLYKTAPIDAEGPDFINAVVGLQTPLRPEHLLNRLLAIERSHGRERPFRHAPRSLDLDLLLYGDESCLTPLLTLPHPRLHLRAFVLLPLLELDPQVDIPGLGRASNELKATLDQSIEKLTTPWAP